MNNQIPQKWETENFFIQDTEQSEVGDLQAIYNNVSYVSEWTGVEVMVF